MKWNTRNGRPMYESDKNIQFSPEVGEFITTVGIDLHELMSEWDFVTCGNPDRAWSKSKITNIIFHRKQSVTLIERWYEKLNVCYSEFDKKIHTNISKLIEEV
jgi:hypothetical protein